MVKALSLLSSLGLSFFILCACTKGPIGSSNNPLKVVFIPYIEQQTIVTHTDALIHFLEKSLSQKLLKQDSGFHIKSSIPTSYVAVVEAFGTQRADLAALTTFSYLMTRDFKGYPVEAILTVDRFPDGRTYKGAIIARSDSKINSIADLQGKKFAFAEPASTSGFIMPSKLFKDHGIKLKETVFAGRHDTVVSMVYQQQVDAGAIYYSSPEVREVNGKKEVLIRDARSTVKTQIPDVENQVKIIGFTDAVPNEPWVLRTNIYPEKEKQEALKKALQEALIEFASLPEGKDMMQILVRAEKIVLADDSEYNPLREVLKSLDIDLASLVK